MSDFSKIEEIARTPNKKILAIKEYRELTGKSLKESKKAVEHFQRTGSWDIDAEVDVSLDSIAELVTSGQKIQAIKEYREVTGSSLKEAKEAIEYFQDTGTWDDEEDLSDEILIEQIEILTSIDKKEEAIKLYREKTGKSLKESKQAVEHFDCYGNWDVESQSSEKNLDDVIALVEDGKKMQAIQLHRELTGQSLKYSKEMIEHYEEFHQWEQEQSEDEDELDDDTALDRLNEHSINARGGDDVFTQAFLVLGVILTFILSVFGLLFYLGKF